MGNDKLYRAQMIRCATMTMIALKSVSEAIPIAPDAEARQVAEDIFLDLAMLETNYRLGAMASFEATA